ncbi:uncharacterized protein LOC127497865 [Ctenopharyngodon idella]|uniref:uncharacterized protein LOC127497865 n=1 Tax=Ctenopharyngodon idella TaxID=7959 RepID=UPI00223203F5|nr:uncharacterized protein LOC127497865 [Ctenopharyngodon idella]
MDKFHSHDVKDLQSMKSVSGTLNEGIVSVCNICKSLMDAHVDPTTDMCSNYRQIREHIEHAEQCMKKTETVIKEKLRYLDERMEQLIREKCNIEHQKKEKRMAMDKLHTEKNSAEELLKYSKAALEQAGKNLESAKYALRRAQERRNTGEGVAIAGGVLLAIPVIGWIAGSIMLSQGLQELNEASNAITAAKWEKQNSDIQVMNCTTQVSYYQETISRTQNEIEQTNEALKNIEWEIKGVQTHLKGTGEIQEMVRKAMNFLGVLGGRVTVLERQTQCFILWEPVVKTMEDVMKAVVNIAENRLLYSQGVPGLINALRENVGGLRALCNSASNSENTSYY